MERRVLTIEADYCKNWSVVDAIREIIQNSIDTGTEIDIRHDGSICNVWDNGNGLKTSDFILGRSSKRDDPNAVGQFGEGLKIGCLVLARENRKVYITSANKRYDFSIQYDKAWEEDLLTIDIDDFPTENGTNIYVECLEDEVNTASSLFLKLNPQRVIDKVANEDGVKNKIEILDRPGIIYVNGLAITKIDSLYGYNFDAKELVNRDRTAVNYSDIKRIISHTLSTTTNREIIANILKTAIDKEWETMPIEFDVAIYPRKITWRRVIKELFGSRVCVSSHNAQIDLSAIEKNWVVLNFPWSLWYGLTAILPQADKVIKDTKRIIPLNKLSTSEREFFNRGKKIAEEIATEAGLKVYPVKVFIDTVHKEGTKTFMFNQTGYYISGTAGVCYQTIKEGNLGEFIGILLHEFVHGTCGHPDNTRSFENDLTDVIASLGLAWYTEKHNKIKIGGSHKSCG